MKNNAVVISDGDNVAVAVCELKAGSEVMGVPGVLSAATDIPRNHKLALVPIRAGEPVIKFGEPIGRASADIRAGEWVHTHNLKSEGD